MQENYTYICMPAEMCSSNRKMPSHTRFSSCIFIWNGSLAFPYIPVGSVILQYWRFISHCWRFMLHRWRFMSHCGRLSCRQIHPGVVSYNHVMCLFHFCFRVTDHWHGQVFFFPLAPQFFFSPCLLFCCQLYCHQTQFDSIYWLFLLRLRYQESEVAFCSRNSEQNMTFILPEALLHRFSIEHLSRGLLWV